MKQSTKKVTWNEIAGEIKNINNDFYDAVNGIISEDEVFCVAEYLYGEQIAGEDFFSCDTDIEVSNFPICMVLDKSVSVYLRGTRIGYTATKGDIIPKNFKPRELIVRTRKSSAYDWHAGQKNILIMPMFLETKYYNDIATKYSFLNELHPDNASDHYHIIKKILDFHVEKNTQVNVSEYFNWKTKLLVFPEALSNKIKNDNQWYRVKDYFHHRDILSNDFSSNLFFLDFILMDIINEHKLSLKDLTIQISKYILSVIACGELGYVPTISNDNLPKNLIAKLLLNEKFSLNTPIIIQKSPYKLCDINCKSNIVYIPIYSTDFSLKRNQYLVYPKVLLEIKNFISILTKSLKSHFLSTGTIYEKIHDNVEFDYFTVYGGNGEMRSALDLKEYDSRFKNLENEYLSECPKGISQKNLFTRLLIGLKVNRKNLYNIGE